MDLFAKMRWYWQFECFNDGVVIFSIYLIIVLLILVENIETVRKTVCVNKCLNALRKFPNESVVHCDVLARMFRNSVKKNTSLFKFQIWLIFCSGNRIWQWIWFVSLLSTDSFIDIIIIPSSLFNIYKLFQKWVVNLHWHTCYLICQLLST